MSKNAIIGRLKPEWNHKRTFMKATTMTRALFVAIFSLSIIGCGQKGPLVPPPDKPNTNKTQSQEQPKKQEKHK